MRSGYVPIRNGILEHLEVGRLGSFDLGVYIRIHLEADYSTGIWQGSAAKLMALAPADESLSKVHASLRRLEKIGFIRRFVVRGKRGNYPVLINKFEVRIGKWKGCRLNADKSQSWRNPVYGAPTESCNEAVTEPVSETAPIKEVRGNSRKTTRGQTSPHHAIRVWCADDWESRFGRKPAWAGRDNKALKELLQARPDLTLDEVKRVWQAYVSNRKHFYSENGWPLWAFCMDFDGLSQHRDGSAVGIRTGNGESLRGRPGDDSRQDLVRFQLVGKKAEEVLG